MNDCFEGSLKAGPLGATVEQDLGALIAPDKLQQCASYTLTVLPSDKLQKAIEEFESESEEEEEEKSEASESSWGLGGWGKRRRRKKEIFRQQHQRQLWIS